MDKDLKISILDLELQRVHYEINDNKQSDDKKLDIKYEIQENNLVYFTIDFKFIDENIIVKGRYVFLIRLGELEQVDDFVERNKEDIIHPVYMKISSLVSTLTDHSFSFPTILPPFIWLDEDE